MAKRVVVAMSGGVDSSVAAALMVQQGYEVIGIMMRLWSEESTDGAQKANRCCTPDQMNDARRIADGLGIPFYVLDTQDVFRGAIVQYFICSIMRWPSTPIIWQRAIMRGCGRRPTASINCSKGWTTPRTKVMC